MSIDEQPTSCADGRIIVVSVARDGALKLDSESLNRDELETRLHDVFKTMEERVVFVKAGPGLSVQEVVQVIDIARTQVDYVALVTPFFEKKANETLSGV